MLPHHQFFFIKYRWRRKSGDQWNHENKYIGEHPIHWLASWRKKYSEQICLDFYKEVTAEMFEKYVEEFE